MGWYDSAWRFRAAVSVAHTSGVTPQDVTIALPANFDHFWNNVESAAEDLRLVAADGETLLNYSITGFNSTNRTGTVEGDGITMTANSGMYLLWIYYGNSAASDAQVATTIASAETGAIELAEPSISHANRIQPEQIGDDRPRGRMQKGAAEQLYIGFDARPVLRSRAQASASSRVYEEVFYAIVTVEAAGSPQSSMVDGAKQRFIEIRGALWILAFVKAGTTATNYTVVVEINTYVPPETTHRILEPRFMLRIKDQAET